MNTTKIAVGLPMPNSTMPSGIQAIGAIGARPRMSGSSMSETVLNAEMTMPVISAATKPIARPTSTRTALTRMAIGIGIASAPKPTLKSLSTA